MNRRRVYALRLVAVVLSVTVVWGIPEVIVRLSHPVLGQYRGITFGGDDNSPLLFQEDPRLHWRLRAGTQVAFLQTLVRINRHGFRGLDTSRSGRTVLCMGSSTTFGWRIPEGGSFPAQLEALLRARRPKERWQVINAGVPGYSSFQVRLQAERLLREWRPELVVICVGNNDGWPAHQSDRSLDDAGRRGRILERFVSQSWFLVWAREQLYRRKPQPFVADSLVGASPRVSREELADNLSAVIDLARRLGIRTVLLSPPVNLYQPPFMLRDVPGSEDARDWYLHQMTHLEAGETAEVLPVVEQALAENPRDSYALWIKGAVMSLEEEGGASRALLEEALEQHPFPESAKASYRRVIDAVATTESVAFLDVNDIFLSAGGEPDRLYLDHVHPTEEGHRLIAENLVPLILGL